MPRIIGMRLPLMADEEGGEGARPCGTEGSLASVIVVVCFVAFMLVAWQLSVDSWGGSRKNCADVRYVDTQMELVENQLAEMQLSMERQHAAIGLVQLRAELLSLRGEIQRLGALLSNHTARNASA